MFCGKVKYALFLLGILMFFGKIKYVLLLLEILMFCGKVKLLDIFMYCAKSTIFSCKQFPCFIVKIQVGLLMLEISIFLCENRLPFLLLLDIPMFYCKYITIYFHYGVLRFVA